MSEKEAAAVLQQERRGLKFIFLSYDCNLALCGLDPQGGHYASAKVKDSPERLVGWAKLYNRGGVEYGVVNSMWVEHMAGGYYERRLLGSVLVESWLAMQPRTEWIVLG